MTPTPPSPDDDLFDLIGLDMKPEKPKAQTAESDFEKELEALFAEDLTEPEIKAPAADLPSAFGEDILDLEIPAPAAAPAAMQDDDVLDLGGFSAPAPAPDDDVLDLGDFSAPAPGAAQDDDVLDLGDFSTGGALDITPPEDIPGGKDGDIDTAALDDLISGLGEGKKPEPSSVEQPLDDTDMSELLETLDIPKAAPLSEPADEMLELSLGDLVEGMPAAEPLAEPVAAAPAAAPDLELSLPDLSDPEPMSYAQQDLGGDLNLSLADAETGAAGLGMGGELLPDSGDLDLTSMMEGGMMEGLEAPAEEPAAAQSLDAAALLDQIPDGPAAEPQDGGGLSLGAAGLGVAAAGALAAGAYALGKPSASAEARSEIQSGSAPLPPAVLQDLQEKLAALATQITGGSVAVVRLEGQLAEKDQALAAMEQRLQNSRDESNSLRRELSDLRAQLEETLRQRAQADERAAMEIKERLALVEDRQIQIDRDVRTEIERAVPREAARVIREEIAALAASMHDE